MAALVATAGIFAFLGIPEIAAASTFEPLQDIQIWDTIVNLPLWVKITAGAVTATAATIGGFSFYSSRRTNEWKNSQSAKDLARIKEAKEYNDIKDLQLISEGARERYENLNYHIEEAESRGRKKLNNRNKDTVKKAKRLIAYDLLIITLADLAKNSLATDPSKRIGGELPAVWKERLDNAEQEAIETNFDGKLALKLKSLANEIRDQRTITEELNNNLKTFDAAVPSIFGGEMKEELKGAKAELENFQSSETAEERALYQNKNTGMRRRVSRRLYSEREDYKQHWDRYDSLGKLLKEKLTDAADRARQVDTELREMISEYDEAARNYRLARSHRSVPVTRYRTNHKGEQETYTAYEDQSAPYRSRARSAESDAQEAARKANRKLGELRTMLPALHRDRTIFTEGLKELLPKEPGKNVDADSGFGYIGAVLLPPIFGMFSSMSSSSDGQRARRKFKPVLESLERVEALVKARKNKESKWINNEIDIDLAKQIKKASSKLKSAGKEILTIALVSSLALLAFLGWPQAASAFTTSIQNSDPSSLFWISPLLTLISFGALGMVMNNNAGDDETIEDALAALERGEVKERLQAISDLNMTYKYDERAWKAVLRTVTQDTDPKVRAKAIRALNRFNQDRRVVLSILISVIEEIMHDKTREPETIAAIQTVSQLNIETGIEFLRAISETIPKDEKFKGRASLLSAIRQELETAQAILAKSNKVIDQLIEKLDWEHNSVKTRINSINELSEFAGSSKAKEAIIGKAKADPSIRVKTAAIKALSRFKGDSDALNFLHTFIKDGIGIIANIDPYSTKETITAIETISRMGDKKSLELIKELALIKSMPGQKLGERQIIKKKAAQKTLSDLIRVGAIAPLKTHLFSLRRSDKPAVRIEAVKNIGLYHGNARAGKALIKAAKTDLDQDVRMHAMANLINFENKETVDTLQSLAQKAEFQDARAAIWTLSFIGTQEALDALKNLADLKPASGKEYSDRETLLKQVASDSLEEIEQSEADPFADPATPGSIAEMFITYNQAEQQAMDEYESEVSGNANDAAAADEQVEQYLKNLATSKDPKFRANTARSLREYTEIEIVRHALIIAAKTDTDQNVRIIAIQSLQKIKHAEAAEALSYIILHPESTGSDVSFAILTLSRQGTRISEALL
ncbi:HEAT repeat domain-containing protein, partial [Elusimicrobiota bacterium]